MFVQSKIVSSIVCLTWFDLWTFCPFYPALLHSRFRRFSSIQNSLKRKEKSDSVLHYKCICMHICLFYWHWFLLSNIRFSFLSWILSYYLYFLDYWLLIQFNTLIYSPISILLSNNTILLIMLFISPLFVCF